MSLPEVNGRSTVDVDEGRMFILDVYKLASHFMRRGDVIKLSLKEIITKVCARRFHSDRFGSHIRFGLQAKEHEAKLEQEHRRLLATKRRFVSLIQGQKTASAARQTN